MFGARDKLTGSSKTRVRRRLDIAQLTGVNILSARMSEKTQRAKEALLCQPLSCQEGGGYLAGYMLIKSLWRFMQIHDERFAQPEVFLLKVYEIFYEDTEFVRLLLDQSQSIPEALGPLASHLLKRTNYAFSDVKESLHEYYDALVEARSHLYRDENEEGRVLPFSDLRDLQPTQRFLEIWEMVMGSPITSLPKNSNDWYNSQVATLAMHMIGIGRDLLELGSLPAQLSTEDAETNVLVNGHTVTRLPTISGVPMGQNGGNVHVFLNTRNGDYVVVAVSDELMPIAIQKTSEAADIDDVSLYRTIMGRIQGVPSIQRLLSDSTDDLNQLKELTRLDGYLKQTRERLDGIYPMFATIEVPVSALEELIPKMMVDGIYGAFDYDADLVRALAIIGSMAHVHLSKETLAAKFEKQGLDFGLLLDKLRMYSEATNLFLIRDEFGFSSSL